MLEHSNIKNNEILLRITKSTPRTPHTCVSSFNRHPTVWSSTTARLRCRQAGWPAQSCVPADVNHPVVDPGARFTKHLKMILRSFYDNDRWPYFSSKTVRVLSVTETCTSLNALLNRIVYGLSLATHLPSYNSDIHEYLRCHRSGLGTGNPDPYLV